MKLKLKRILNFEQQIKNSEVASTNSIKTLTI